MSNGTDLVKSSAPIYLGRLSDGKDAVIERLEKLPEPLYSDLMPGDVELQTGEQDQLHPGGFSLRYKEISKKRLEKTIG